MGKWGSLPMNGQVSCEGPEGKQSLLTIPGPPPFTQDLDSYEKVDPATIKVEMGYGTFEETAVKEAEAE